VCAGVAGAVWVGISWSTKYRKPIKSERSGITLQDLRNPANREDHLAFNSMLLGKFPDVDAVRIDDELGGSEVFLVHKHRRVVEVISDHKSFTSNPWPWTRPLVTLNTMDKTDHDRVYKLLKRFYSPAAVKEISEKIDRIVSQHGPKLESDNDAYKFSKRVHMHLSLLTSGLVKELEPSSSIIDEFIEFNDASVRLAAPLGGVGSEPEFSFTRFRLVVRSLIASLSPVARLCRRIGFFQTWRLLSPLESMFPSAPYTHCWDYPDDLPRIPMYFNRLYDLMSTASIDSPAGQLYSNIGTNVSPSEALATAVQLMVNMTTANAIMSLIYRKTEDPSITPVSVLQRDAPLQRNPRRAVRDTKIGSVPIRSGSLILLMLGSANEDCPAGGISMTFGFGLHHCLGRHLVVCELEAVDKWIAERRVSLIEPPQRLVGVDVGNWGFRSLKVRLS
jgi:hypothetical protein